MTEKNGKVRKHVPLDREDLADLTTLRITGTNKADALADLLGKPVKENASEAEVLHDLVVLGRRAVADKALELSYRRAAEVDARDPERITWRRAMRRHRVARPFLDGEATA
jgi:hypothetical protein